MKTDLDTLATALYARIDDELKASPWLAPWRPKVGITPTLSDAELLTLAVMSALLGYTSERRWLRRVDRDFRGLFPYVPQQSGYGKRLRAASPLLTSMIRMLAQDTSLWTDDVWLVDSTPVGCGCSRETAKRSDLAGWAEYGYCASHSRYFWGLRLHLVCTLGGLPILFALTGAKADERETLRDMLDSAPDVQATHPQQTIIGDKNYYGREFENDLTERDLKLLRPARKGEPERAGAHLFKPLRQVIESINQTLKGQLDLERHGGKTQGRVVNVFALVASELVTVRNMSDGAPLEQVVRQDCLPLSELRCLHVMVPCPPV
ncbi:IS982 family transposase [Actinacidiphila glaucinigra]|uniref:IS982 family transposase n=1 Tax=Actinacidiphila glaucinigra TaxID=235986 RepID=UPI003D8CBF06